MRPTNTCPDAETLAAWVDGGLSKNDTAMAEAHVSSCPRCQEIAALIVKTTPATAVAPPWWRARARWLVPVTAVVAAVGVWIITPTSPAPPPEPAAGTAKLEPAPKPVAPAAPTLALPAPDPGRVPPQQPGQPRGLQQEKEQADRSRALAKDEAPALRAETYADKKPEARANAAVPAAPAAAVPAEAGQLARQSVTSLPGKEAVSPDGALHWRITDRGTLERSTDRGTAWQAVTVGITATFTTVQAPEPRNAIVTTADGRQFRTTDSGATWKPVPK